MRAALEASCLRGACQPRESASVACERWRRVCAAGRGGGTEDKGTRPCSTASSARSRPRAAIGARRAHPCSSRAVKVGLAHARHCPRPRRHAASAAGQTQQRKQLRPRGRRPPEWPEPAHRPRRSRAWRPGQARTAPARAPRTLGEAVTAAPARAGVQRMAARSHAAGVRGGVRAHLAAGRLAGRLLGARHAVLPSGNSCRQIPANQVCSVLGSNLVPRSAA